MRRTLLVALLVISCSPNEEAAPVSTTVTAPTTTSTTSTIPTTTTTHRQPFEISSPAFDDGGAIPREFTCDGADVSPELDIVGIPPATQSLAIVVDDPDAPVGTWDHWVEFNISSQGPTLEVPRASESIGEQGINSWHIVGYMGPCPPEGEEHEYKFTVYALDTLLELPQRIESGRLHAAMDGHVIASTVLTGIYQR